MVAESSNSNISITLRVWRQAGPGKPGKFVDYQVKDINVNMSFLEMLDVLNEQLTLQGQEPIAFAHDCREGICGTCSLVIDGKPHGPHKGVASCQTYMRSFADGATITVEPFRAHPFPVIKDLITDRAALDQIQQAGGFISIRTGAAPDANSIPVPKDNADLAMDAASCIGCGACVAACPNGAAMLFVGAKVAHLAVLPQGQVEAPERVAEMIQAMRDCGFGNCSNHYECEAVCPKGISVKFIAKLNREFLKALILAKTGPFKSSD